MPPCIWPLSLQLAPDLAHTIHTVVFIIHALYLHLQQVIMPRSLTAPVRIAFMLLMPVIRRRGDIQLVAYRSDPVLAAQGIHQGRNFSRGGRTPPSQSTRKPGAGYHYCDAVRGLRAPAPSDAGVQWCSVRHHRHRYPVHAGESQVRRVSGVQLILGAMELRAAHCEPYSSWLSRTKQMAR